MADEVDIAQEQMELEYRYARLAAQHFREEVSATGECLWCGEALEDGRRWCNAECRDSWERWGR